ncbi:MAG: hypothetical protein IKY83_06130 [Proteobacteria bacterium]|nr:hypothetical protein [Pseudomonadota bacterium]
MKKLIFTAITIGTIFFISACTEEGYTKVFQCSEGYPYFSTITHQCYKTEADMEKGETQFLKNGSNDE